MPKHITGSLLPRIAVAAAVAVTVITFWPRLDAQEREPDVEAAYDTPEMKRIVNEVDSMSIPDHATLILRLRKSLDRRILTPSPEAVSRYSDLTGRKDAGVTRLVQRGLFDKRAYVRGAGCYFSFTTRSHDYNKNADLSLQQWRFSSGFHGGCTGHVMALDSRDLRSVGVADVPEKLRVAAEDASELFHGMRGERVAMTVGAVYAVRSIHFDESDVLVAFTVVDKDDYGVNIAWRILEQRAPTARRRRAR